MRSTLYLKFFIIYIVFGFLSLFTVATLTSTLTMSKLKSETTGKLYKEANLIATDYLPGYFSETTALIDVRTQLEGMRTYLDCTIWFVDHEGKLITSAKTENAYAAPLEIESFNPAEGGSAQYIIGTYHDYFAEDVITVIAPITKGFNTKGYVLLHKPLSDLYAQRDMSLNTVYLTLLVIFLLSFSILIAVHFFIYVPLRRVTEAARQYALGNLEYEVPVTTQDEMGTLSASLNYMSSQLRDMEDYQKKFVANVSHDFRSPLTSIKGYVEAMTDGTIPVELHEKYLKIILFETERLTDLTHDLLALNDYDSKELLLNRENFDIHDMIKHTAASFEGTCTTKKISIELLFCSRNLLVDADKRKIQQVLYNLLDNAIKFSNPESDIVIETTERGDKVFISVKDNGIGIPRDGLNKIWERFYKSDLSRGKDKKGTGLGLAIVKEAIQAHGENINVISTEGVGTEFIFSLPRAS